MANYWFLGALLLVANVAALEHIFHDGKEYKYSYEVYSTSGALDPTTFASAFAYRGILRIQAHANDVVVKLDDITMATYNGKYDFNHYPEMTFVSKPELTSEMSHPFRIGYKKNGQVNLVEVPQEKEWATNMKKAIATLLQIHLESLQKKNEVFTLDENTIHGNCPVNYDVSPCPDDPEHTRVIRKHRHNHDCHNKVFRSRTTNLGHFCPEDKLNNDPVHSSSFQTYHVEDKDGHEHVKRIDVMSQTIFRPFDNAGLSQFSFINHTILLESFGDIQDEIKLEGELKQHDHLDFHFSDDEHPKTVEELKVPEEFFSFKIDYTLSQADILQKVEEQLSRAADSLDTHHIHKDIVTAYKASLYLAIPYATALDYDHWKKLYEHVKDGITTDKDQTIKALCLELLPMTGTSPAALTLLDIINEDEEDRPLLLRLLSTVPFQLQEPTEILTEQFAHLPDKYNTDGENKRISYRVATLALANLVSRTCKHHCSEDFLNKYIDLFYHKLEQTSEESEQLLYISALHSIATGRVAELMLPIAQGKTQHSLAVRLQAIWATHGLGAEDRHRLHREILPLFFDKTENYEVRINAFSLVMSQQPNFDELQQIAVSLFNEKSLQVAHFVYTMFTSISKNNHPCYEKMAKDTSFLLKYMTYVKVFILNPRYSGFYAFDYYDPKYNFGHLTTTSIVASTDSLIPRKVYVGFHAYISGFSTKYFSMYVRQTGLSDSIYKHLAKVDLEDLKQGDLKAIFDKLQIQPRPQHPFKLEIGFMTGSNIIAHIYVDETSFDGLTKYFGDASKLQENFHLNKQMAMMYLNGLYEEPSDLGTPVGIITVSTGLSSFRGNFTHEGSGTTVYRDNDFDLHFVTYFSTVVTNYNPTTAFFHNVARHRIFNYNVPRSIRLGIDFSQQQLKISSDVPTHEDPVEVVFHASTIVNVRSFGDNNVEQILHESCAECNFLEQVSKGKNARKSLMLVNHNFDLTGEHFHAEIFDCEKKGGYGEFLHLLKRTFSSEHKSVKHNPLITGFLGFSNLIDYFWTSPSGETCGIHATYMQNTQDPTSRIESTIRVKYQEDSESDIIWKGGKYLIRGTLIFRGVEGKSEDHKWDLNTMYQFDRFRFHNEMKVKLVRAPVKGHHEEEYVTCVEFNHHTPTMEDVEVVDMMLHDGADKLYTSNSEVNVVWGESSGSKCPADKAGIKMDIVAKRSHEQKALIKEDIWPYNQCRKEKEDKETWPGQYMPFTWACKQAALQQTTPLRTEIKLKYNNLPEGVKRAYRTWLTLVKTVLYPYWQVDHVGDLPQADHHGDHGSSEGHEDHRDHSKVKVGPGEIAIIRELSAVDELVDLHIHSDVEHNHFENIDYSRFSLQPPSMANVRFWEEYEFATKVGLLGFCSVGPHYVISFDNVTYNTDIRDCYTLVSSDCSDDPKYALFVKADKDHHFSLKFFAGGHAFEIKDVNSPIVTLDGEDHDASGKGYQYPEKDALPLFQAVHFVKFYSLWSPAFQVGVHFNGEHVYPYISSRYRNHQCGLCGNFDSEKHDELEGPNHCHLDNGKDMAYAYSLPEGDCSRPDFECHPQVHRHRRDADFSKSLVGSLLSKLN